LKKAISIVLLTLFLFNVGGYYLAFWALEYKVNNDLTVRLDRNQYSESETFELKVPVALPYPVYQTEYERVDGKFEYNGEFYKLVKHKLQNDTLYIVCIKNLDQKELVNTITDYVNISNDLPGTAKKAINFFGKLLKEYDSHPVMTIVSNQSWTSDLSYKTGTQHLVMELKKIPSPPPKV
jgi:hypothetical protein